MRLKNIFRNSFFSLLSQFALIIVGFFSQRVMNLRMGEELVGMNGVISNVIAILSVSELGIASAIVYHLYQALAAKDEKEIASLMNLYRRAYLIFAAAISVLGLLVLPFIHLLMKDNSFSVSYIRVIYLLWLVRTVLSYLLTYKRSILVADQKEYIVSIVTLLMNVLNYSAIIVILELTRNYILALGLNIVIEFVLNIWTIRYVDKKYPYLKKTRRNPLEKHVIAKVFQDLKNIFVSRLATKLLVSTDNLIISGFISVAVVGLYSNYCLITQSVTNVMLALSNAIQPSVGNLFTEGNMQKNYQVLRQIAFVFFMLAAVCTAGILSLATPFVTDFWLNDNYRLNLVIVTGCVFNVYLFIINLPIAMMMTVSGLFDKERNIAVVSAVANLLLSLVLVRPLGVSGVLIGTSVSYLVQIGLRIWHFFHNYMKQSGRQYGLDMLQYIFLAGVETYVLYGMTKHIYADGGIVRFVLCAVLCICLPVGVNLLIYHRSWRFQSLAGYLVGFLNKKKGGNRENL